MRDYRRFGVWEKAHLLALSVYRVTQRFPQEERFGLTSQIRRAAVSIPSNIAEGSGRGGDTEFARFVHIAAGSVNEVEYQCLLARELGFMAHADAEEIDSRCSEVRRMLVGLAGKLAKDKS